MAAFYMTKKGDRNMLKEKTELSLEVLLLNDLLRMKAIDKDTYDKALQKMSSTEKENGKQKRRTIKSKKVA